MACTITADNGSTSGSAGLKSAADSTGALSIKVGSGSVTAATFDASGNMGIGVTPSAWGGVALQIASGYAVSQYGVSKNAYYDGANYKYIAGASYATLYQGGDAHIWYTTTSAQGAGNTITWSTAMSLGGGSAAPSLDISHGTGTELSNAKIVLRKYDNNTTISQVFAYFQINGAGTPAGSGQINANGASQAAFGSYSDRRLKENIVDMQPQLANLLSLRPVEFDYIDGSGHQLGFIAQDVQEVYPDLIGERADGMLTLSGLGKNEARLIKAIQELAAQNTELKQRIAALEAK